MSSTHLNFCIHFFTSSFSSIHFPLFLILCISEIYRLMSRKAMEAGNAAGAKKVSQGVKIDPKKAPPPAAKGGCC
jgi:hypothetical protein